MILTMLGLGAAGILAVPPAAALAGDVVRMDELVCDGLAADRPQAPGTLDTGLPPFVGPFPESPYAIASEQIKGYEVELTLNADASMDVFERIDYEFPPYQERRGIFRDIRLEQPCTSDWNRAYPLRDVRVSSPTGASSQVSIETIEEVDGGVRLRIGNPDITFVGGRHTYEIRYTLEGVVNPFAEHDELYWNAVGPGWDVPVHNAVVRVNGPASPTGIACYAGDVGSTSLCDAAVAIENQAAFQEQILPFRDALTVVVAYPKGSFSHTPRYYVQQWSLARAFSLTPLTVGGASGLMAVAIGGVLTLGFVIGRDRRAIGAPTDIAFAQAGTKGVMVRPFEDASSPVEFIPPEKVRPAQFALVRNEEVRNVDVSATIVDLAVRGYLRIEESGGTKRKPDYRVVLLDKPIDPLLGYERTLVNSLFPGGLEEVLLSDLEDSFATKLAKVRDGIYADAVSRHWFAHRPDTVKARWHGIGFLVTVVGAGLLVAAIAFTEVALLPIPIVVAGFLLWAFAGRFPRRTPAGTGLRRRIGGFELFMTDSEAPRAQWAENRNIFSDYLGYAIVLGITKKWARTFEPLGAEAVAASMGWYVGTEPFSFNRFSSATDRFASTAGSTLSSTPASTSGSSGFSGGSSGGGGGGGGGGSW
jgi:uncharacterized membrane protein YgcG